MSRADPRSDNERLGSPQERRSIVLRKGETFWQLAEIKYSGKHPIDAIFQANELLPTVTTDENGAVSWKDPVYFAGATYVLPALAEIPELQKEFWNKMEEAGGGPTETQKRVGAPGERTAVCLRWDESLWQLAELKYDKEHPIKAIYEANGLIESFIFQKQGNEVVLDPVVQAGNTYIFPAQSEIQLLTQRYDKRISTILRSK